MQNELLENDMKVQRYKERINLPDELRVDYSSLRLIQGHHMLHIPFENLNIVRGLPIKLDLESLYEKIIVKKRGGYCYELNGLLAWLLKSLGFSVSLLSGQVIRDDGTYGPEFDHLVLLVHLNHDYIVDVGFGDSVRSPLPLSGEKVTDVSGSYRIMSDLNSDVRFFQKETNNEWKSEFQFTLNPRRLKDFREMNIYQQTSPDSHFTKNTIVSIATPDGRISISGESFIETVGSEKRRSSIISDDEKIDLLKRYFGLELK